MGMINHVDNECIQGWDKIAIAWGFKYPEAKKESRIKQSRRFFEKIEIPFGKEPVFIKPVQHAGPYVFTDQDMICTLKNNYLFGRQDIANYLGKSVIQFSRDRKKFPALAKKRQEPKILREHGKFIYANKHDLSWWKDLHEYYNSNKMGKLKAQSEKHRAELQDQYEQNRIKLQELDDNPAKRQEWIEKQRDDFNKFLLSKETEESLLCPVCNDPIF